MHLKAIENFYVRGIVQVLLSNGPIYWQRVICGRDNVCFGAFVRYMHIEKGLSLVRFRHPSLKADT